MADISKDNTISSPQKSLKRNATLNMTRTFMLFPFLLAYNNDEFIQNIRTFDKSEYEKSLLEYYSEQGFSEYGDACKSVMQLIENARRKEFLSA